VLEATQGREGVHRVGARGPIEQRGRDDLDLAAQRRVVQPGPATGDPPRRRISLEWST